MVYPIGLYRVETEQNGCYFAPFKVLGCKITAESLS
ncbi:hypothetical protein A5880_001288 [Enterococcus sp. 4G2_DIV0659]|uniref:Uncharacterized protein n=1 Tax=Candidatus Enterococcus mansonii TaxID=1834181 RepID=A0A242CCI8_9ENTE|nr:hypothetical protein A5880_002149 [Enterococcus sp. 4G2_DIV0659]